MVNLFEMAVTLRNLSLLKCPVIGNHFIYEYKLRFESDCIIEICEMLDKSNP